METKFIVQVGYGPKGSYHTRYSSTDQAQANFYYAGVNNGNGYKKRLVRVDGRPGQAKQLLARATS